MNAREPITRLRSLFNFMIALAAVVRERGITTLRSDGSAAR